MPDLVRPSDVRLPRSPSQKERARTAQPAISDLSGRWVTLRPVLDDDLPFLYHITTNPLTGFRWRYRGEMISYNDFVADRHRQSTSTEFLITNTNQTRRLGHVLAHDLNLRDRTVYIAMALAPGALGHGWAVEAGGLLVDYLFATYDLRKIYAETVAYNTDAFASDRVFRVEARMVDHLYHSGRYWDSLIVACFREQWLDRERRVRRSAEAGRLLSVALERDR